jgi:hypothetical protein
MAMKNILGVFPKKSQRVVTVAVGVLLLSSAGIIFLAPRHSSLPRPVVSSTTYSKDSLPAHGRTLLRLDGTGNARSESFKAPAKWDLYWNFQCDEQPVGSFRITAATPALLSQANLKAVSARGISGFGDQPYASPGNFRLLIQTDAGCEWHVTVKAD